MTTRGEWLGRPCTQFLANLYFRNGPKAAGRKCCPQAAIDLPQRVLEIQVFAYGKL